MIICYEIRGLRLAGVLTLLLCFGPLLFDSRVYIDYHIISGTDHRCQVLGARY